MSDTPLFSKDSQKSCIDQNKPLISSLESSVRRIEKTEPMKSLEVQEHSQLAAIIRAVPDVVYEFAKDVVLALVEREKFSVEEIGNLKRADITVGGPQLLEHRLSEETTSTIAVFIGAVNTYLGSHSWKRKSDNLFSLSTTDQIGVRPLTGFADVNTYEAIEARLQSSTPPNLSYLSESDQAALRERPHHTIQTSDPFFAPLSDSFSEASDADQKERERREDNQDVQLRIRKLESQIASKAQHGDVQERGNERASINRVEYSESLRIEMRELVEQDEFRVPAEVREKVQQSIRELEQLCKDTGVFTGLTLTEKKGLRLNCDMLTIQLNKVIARADIIAERQQRLAHQAIRYLETDPKDEAVLLKKLEKILRGIENLSQGHYDNLQ